DTPGGCADPGALRRPARARWPALLLAVLATLADVACGDDDDEGPSAGTTASTAADAGSGQGREERAERRELVTRPDLTPPVIDVTVDEAPSPGLLFMAPKQAGAQTGPLIVDDAGEVVWSHPTGDDTAADFRVQTYRGEPVLTWYEGSSLGGYGEGEFVIADDSYHEVARVAAGRGRAGDLHELQLTDTGTALVIAYATEPADLSAADGPADGFMQNCYVQEIDVATGRLLFEWNARDHVDMADTYSEVVPDAAATDDPIDDDGSEEAPFDWFHANSVSADGPDTLLVSARNTHAVYAVDRRSGELRWTLGGRSSDFTFADGAAFAWQHDARRQPDGTISMFDNEATPPVGDESRGLVLALDGRPGHGGTARVVREITHPEHVQAGSQGNTQLLDGGRALIGWAPPGG
ncbi:MAG TPA: arylsulfotransferase family protein, partial [Acidimicrobiales bacterium]